MATVVRLKNGFVGEVINYFTYGHKDIRPPYNLKGGFALKGIEGHIGYVKVLPPEIKEIYYGGEVLFSDIVTMSENK